LASVKVEHELRSGDSVVALANGQPDLGRLVVFHRMPYIGYKLRDLSQYSTISEHFDFRVCKRNIAQYVVLNLFVQIACGHLLLFGLIHFG